MVRKEFIVFKTGKENEFTFTLKENDNVPALNVRVTFSIKNEDGEVSTDVEIQDVTIPAGTYTNNVWTVGTMKNVTYNPIFKLVGLNDTAEFAEVTITISSDSGEVNTNNNVGIITYEGISYSELSSVLPPSPQYSQLVELSGTYSATSGTDTEEITLSRALNAGSRLESISINCDTEIVLGGSGIISLGVDVKDSVSGTRSNSAAYINNDIYISLPKNTKINSTFIDKFVDDLASVYPIDTLIFTLAPSRTFTSGTFSYVATFLEPLPLPDAP